MDKESITFESVLMQLTENYQTSCMIVETTACQSWRVFLRHGVYYKFFSDVIVLVTLAMLVSPPRISIALTASIIVRELL